MLHSAKKVKGYAVVATDGKVGTVDDLYFDDSRWTMRYLVVDTGGWLSGRRVLIPPASLAAGGWNGKDKTLQLTLTQQQIRDSPGIENTKPVSRQNEAEIHQYYGYPEYWSGPYLWGYEMFPGVIDPTLQESAPQREAQQQATHEGDDLHLRSCREVIGYDIRTTDDHIGHVADFLFDEQDWSIQLMVVDTRNWWPGKHVLVSPQRIDGVDWESGAVQVRVSRAELESGPEYDSMQPPQPVPPERLQQIYRQVGQPPDWP